MPDADLEHFKPYLYEISRMFPRELALMVWVELVEQLFPLSDAELAELFVSPNYESQALGDHVDPEDLGSVRFSEKFMYLAAYKNHRLGIDQKAAAILKLKRSTKGSRGSVADVRQRLACYGISPSWFFQPAPNERAHRIRLNRMAGMMKNGRQVLRRKMEANRAAIRQAKAKENTLTGTASGESHSEKPQPQPLEEQSGEGVIPGSEPMDVSDKEEEAGQGEDAVDTSS